MGYLPRSSFFIAIKMGSAILMMLAQEIVVEAKESIKLNDEDAPWLRPKKIN
jgi:hypothetical protein